MNRLKQFWGDWFGNAPENKFVAAGNFTPRAQQVLGFASKEAIRLRHNFIGTEHLLLGLICLGQGVAANVLESRGISLKNLRTQIERSVGTGPEQKTIEHTPYTPRVKKVIALAQKEAQHLNHTYVGTEHLLLGLLAEGDGVAAKVLQSLNVNLKEARQAILKELDPNYSLRDEQQSFETGKTEAPQSQPTEPPRADSINASQRFDVYCVERDKPMVVYRNVLFKGTKQLFASRWKNFDSEFVELELSDGKTVFVARYSIVKFCEPGTNPTPENL